MLSNIEQQIVNAIQHEKGSNPLVTAQNILNILNVVYKKLYDDFPVLIVDGSVLTNTVLIKDYLDKEKVADWYICKAIIEGYPLEYFLWLLLNNYKGKEQSKGYYGKVKSYFDFCKLVNEGGNVC